MFPAQRERLSAKPACFNKCGVNKLLTGAGLYFAICSPRGALVFYRSLLLDVHPLKAIHVEHPIRTYKRKHRRQHSSSAKRRDAISIIGRQYWVIDAPSRGDPVLKGSH